MTTPTFMRLPHAFVRNFGLMHDVWHYGEVEYRMMLNYIIRRDIIWFKKTYGKDTSTWPKMIFYDAPAVVSEREPHDTGPRMKIFNLITIDALKKAHEELQYPRM